MPARSPKTVAALLLFAGQAAPAPALQPRLPVVIDTDIGTAFDDSVAILYALQHPALDVKMILTSSDDTLLRAKLVAK